MNDTAAKVVWASKSTHCLPAGGAPMTEMQLSTAELARRVDVHMRLRYRVSLDDLEPAETPGYWQDREPKMHPGHPLHSCLGCGGPFRATYTYFDSPRVGGRFASITRTWAALRANKQNEPDAACGGPS